MDVASSPELKARTRNEGDIKIYDGVNLPYPDNFFDFIYSNQVFEHVRYPDLLLKSVCRVLKPGGYFAGSVSYLEPYHSFSLFNFTPYGLITVVKDAGLHLVELRPGADTFSLLFRQLLNAPKFLSWFFDRFSLFDLCVNSMGAMFGLGHKERNFFKIQFAGHLCFLAIK